jgi:nucleoid-associated protein YgaU
LSGGNLKINTGSGCCRGLEFAAPATRTAKERIPAMTPGQSVQEQDASYQSWSVTTEMASDFTKKIANKAARKKYSASPSGKNVRVKRADTLSKIARRHHVNGGWKCLWRLNEKTIKNPGLIFIGQAIKIK